MCRCGRGVCVWCGVVWHAEKLRVYVQNVTVCTGTTPACGNTCGRGARTHGNVLNVHTEDALNVHTERGVRVCGEGGREGVKEGGSA